MDEVEFAGAVERGLNVGHDVFAADVLEETRVLQQFRGLLHGSAEEQGAAGFA